MQLILIYEFTILLSSKKLSNSSLKTAGLVGLARGLARLVVRFQKLGSTRNEKSRLFCLTVRVVVAAAVAAAAAAAR